MGNCYKAQQASIQSREFALQKNRTGWLDLFADDAIVQDPVGISPLDPAGQGHRGKEAIAAFYDRVIANSNMEFVIEHSIPAGDACANLVELKNTIADNAVLETTMIVVYTANDEGKLVLLQAYWEYDKLQQQMDKLFGGQG